MARQKGGVPIVGRIGALSFYHDKQHGYLIRAAGGPSKEQIKKKKSMEPVRQNNSEFGKASAYGSLVRRAMRPLVVRCKEYTMSRRLQSLLVSIIKMDGSKEPGKRDVVNEHLIALQGFDLNSHLSYRKLFKKDVAIEFKRTTIGAKGYCSIAPMFAKQASHYKVMSVATTIDFQMKTYVTDVKESGFLPCKGSKAFEFEHNPGGTGCLFYGLVISFYNKRKNEFELITEDKMKSGFISFVQ